MNPCPSVAIAVSRLRASLAAVMLAYGAATAGATQVYVDVVSGSGGNTYNHATNSPTDWSVTSGPALKTDNLWGIRNEGSALTGYNSNACELYTTETGAVLRMEITGLQPLSVYSGMRIYMLGSTTSGYNWTLDVSMDGNTWTTYSDYDASGFTGTIVDKSNGGVGAPLSGTLTGTRRFWHALPNATTNASGVLRIFIRRGTGAADRSSFDGIGYDNVPLIAPDPYSNSVSISEFMADNPGPVELPGSVLDMDGDSSDWIELHNSGTATADLSGWKLTDDPLVPDKWTFPSGTLLGTNGRLLVFASGKIRRLNGVELHAGFKLSNSGFLRLSRPAASGPDVVLSVFDSYAAQNPRASYGNATIPPTAPVWGYHTTPTPGAANGVNVPGFVSSADTDVDRGIFNSAFAVTLTCPTPGATILYTRNGSVPTQGNSSTTAILPANGTSFPATTLQITGTTILRTRAVKSGLGASKVDSHTYLFPAQVLVQSSPPAGFPAAAAWSHFGSADWAMDPIIVNHASSESRCTVNDLLSIPSISMVMDWSELFGTSGIYPAISPVPEEGLDKTANIELLNPTGSTASPNSGDHFSVSGRTHVFGGTSQDRWKVDKLSFNFNLTGSVSTGIYGDTATGTSGRFILDARMGNTWLHEWDDGQRTRGDYIRDEVASEVQRLQGYAGTHSRRVHLYLNGMYWGLYTLHEKPDPDFHAAYQGGDPEDWDVLKHSPLRSDCLAGGTFVNPAVSATVRTNNTSYVNYQAMLATVANGVDLTIDTNYAAAAAKLDIDAFIDYMVLNFCLNNFDWSHQNWYASFRRNHPDARWRFHSWDAEHVLRIASEEVISSGISGTGANSPLTDCKQDSTPTFIHQRLATNAEYRMRFADRIQKWCFNGGVLSVDGMTAVCNRQFDEIDAAMRCESARWGDNRSASRPSPLTNVTYTRGVEWLNEKNRMLGTVIPGRLPAFLASMKSKTNPLFPRVDPANTGSAIFQAPAFSQHGGIVPAGFQLSISNPNGTVGTILYTLDGSDPRSKGGASAGSAVSYTGPVTLQGPVTVRSRVKNGNVWSALNEAAFSVGTVAPAAANLTLSKIMWKPSPPSSDDILAGFTDDSDFEYLELYNPSNQTVDLGGIRFSAGLDISLDFSVSLELAPGSRAVLAAKPTAFIHRYGASARVIGAFVNGSNLSGSETLTLEDSSGGVIRSFLYNSTTSAWPKAQTSGTGAALVLIRPELNPDPASGTNWRASAPDNPSPGADDRINLDAWQVDHFGSTVDLTSDADGDGVSNLFEYASGGDPHVPGDCARMPALRFNGGSVHEILFSYRRKKDIVTLDWQLEQASDLGFWSAATGNLEILSTFDHGDGTETINCRHVMSDAPAARFFRIRLSHP